MVRIFYQEYLIYNSQIRIFKTFILKTHPYQFLVFNSELFCKLVENCGGHLIRPNSLSHASTFFFFSLFLPQYHLFHALCPSLFLFSFLFSLLKLNSIILLCNHHFKKKKNKYTYQRHNYVFSHFKYVIWNMIPNTFFALWILKTRIFTTFFKPQFSHRYLNTLT